MYRTPPSNKSPSGRPNLKLDTDTEQDSSNDRGYFKRQAQNDAMDIDDDNGGGSGKTTTHVTASSKLSSGIKRDPKHRSFSETETAMFDHTHGAYHNMDYGPSYGTAREFEPRAFGYDPDISHELVPDAMERPYDSSTRSKAIPIKNNEIPSNTSGSSRVSGTPGGSDQYLPHDLEFNINPEEAMSPTLGMNEADWKAIPFSTRRRLKAKVQQHRGFSPNSPSAQESTFASLPSSVIGGTNRPIAKSLPFSQRQRERSASSLYPRSTERSYSLASDGDSSASNSPAFQFLSRLGNPQADVTSGSNGGHGSQEELGEQVGDHIIGKLIGYGGFSQVKEAHTIVNNKRVVRAVKVVQKFNPASSPEVMEKVQNEFDHEVSIWKTLDHDNILKLIQVEDNSMAVYCITEKIDGGTLFDAVKLNRGTIPPNTIRQYIYQLGSALLYLHETVKIVHRDVKLENCLIDMLPDGSTKVLLCDFGMSEYYESEQKSPNNNSRTHVIGPSDTSSLFNQYHYRRNDRQDGLSIHSPHHPHPSRPASVGSGSGSRSPRSPRSPAGMSGIAALTPINMEPIKEEDPLTSHHSRHHHQHLSSRPSANESPHTPSSTPLGVRGWASPVASGNTTQNFGSLPYACPELLKSSVPIIEPSVDMWAFGVVIHALYMGHLPWNHAFLPKLRMMILQGHWDQESFGEKAGAEALEVTRACLDMGSQSRATIRQVMEHRLLQHERRRYGPKGKRRDDDELAKWSRADTD